MHAGRDVEGGVQRAAVIAGEGGIHQLIANQMAVDVEIEKTETADIGSCPLHDFIGADLKFAAQVACR